MKKYLLVLAPLILFACINNEKNTSNIAESQDITIPVSIEPEKLIFKLPGQLSETSGLIFYKNLFWTFNDSGGKNVLYAVDFNGVIKKEIELKNACNDDWESIAEDKKHIYVGDFGNNSGTRKNLAIYKIKKNKIGEKANQSDKAEVIKFSYLNQQDFSFTRRSTPFDCEAMTEFQDSLYLFSKNWRDQTTWMYKIPKKEGNYKIAPVDSFNFNGLVTGADLNEDETTLALLGYKDFKPMLWVFSDFPGTTFFKGKKQLFIFESLLNAQTEGICFKGNDSLFISCEKTFDFEPQVFLVDLNQTKRDGTH